MAKKKLLYATSNSGKVFEVSRHLRPQGLEVLTPLEVGITDFEVKETGKSLEANALLKVRALAEIAPPGWIVFGDDTGLEIDALNGEPGIFVRRWSDHQTEMTDQEIIDYALEKMAGIPIEQRTAQFRTVIAAILPDGTELVVDGTLHGHITLEAAPIHIPGLPFEGLFYVDEWDILLGDTRQMKVEDKPVDWLSHREKAAQKLAEMIV